MAEQLKYIVFVVGEGEHFPATGNERHMIDFEGEAFELWSGIEVCDEPEVFGPFDTKEEAEAARDQFLMLDLQEAIETDFVSEAFILPIHPSVIDYFQDGAETAEGCK